jgi:hypothetical protein
MDMREHLRLSTRWALLAALLQGTVALAGSEAEPATGPVVVWHALQGPEIELLHQAAERYESSSGVPVELTQFQSHEALYEEFLAASDAGEGPDVLFGDHRVAAPFLERGSLGALCLPGECPECEGSNPPGWCAYASNGLFGDESGSLTGTMIPDFRLGAERCREDGCGECYRSGWVPPYCKYVGEGFDLDLLQASFADFVPGYDRPLPIGFPVFWSYQGVGFDRVRLQEQGQPEPTNVGDLVVLGAGGSSAYDDGDWCPTWPWPWPFPWPWPGPLEEIRPWEVVDIRDSNILVFPSTRAGELQQQVGELVMPVLEDFKSDIVVQGAFLRRGTERRAQALDFMAELQSPDLQSGAFESAGLLPANRDALSAIEELAVPGLTSAGKLGALTLPQDPVPMLH